MITRFKRIIALSMILTLAVAAPAYGDTVIPPLPSQNSQTNQPAQPDTANGNQAVGPDGGAAGTDLNSNTITAVTEPEVKAEGAVLMDAATGKVIYGKNAETRYYPASITKLMTALLVAEKCSLDDVVTFSKTATTNLEAGSVSLNLTEGDKLTVRQCLYALLLKSANEVGNGLAEHTAGSISAFAGMMNTRAAALGCTNTNFVNPHGLNNANHYTTPKDMALIAREAFNNQIVRKVASTLTYDLPATKKSKAATVTMGHKMLFTGNANYDSRVIGGKTGYTSLAKNTLVTVAESDGLRLIVVVMKAPSSHYTDTRALLDYGFDNAAVLGLKGGTATAAKWVKDGSKWYLIKPDQTRAGNEWLNINKADYWFDSDGYMATGWRQFNNGAWYYFKGSGIMAHDCWVQDNGVWFYLGSSGVMLTNTTTPDGYPVDQYGRWQQ